MIWPMISPQGHVFTLPMRNWNCQQNFSTPPWCPRFYFTYEELKHRVQTTVEDGDVCFYFTYEELKHIRYASLKWFLYRFLLYLWGIETLTYLQLPSHLQCRFYFTYEELKQGEGKGPLKDTGEVFTLPMRNWNPGHALMNQHL